VKPSVHSFARHQNGDPLVEVTWQFHAPNGLSPVQNQGMPAVLFCFLFLYMAAQDGGDWSLDALFRRKRQNA
jgi:uncharacterized membrane protein YphA (DoxX/SURF4 family)